MTKFLCTYTVTEDAGLAPNPFGRHCTLAVCIPNHQGVKLEKGDWIAGFLSKERENCFLYAMEIEGVIRLEDYFADARFSSKKPIFPFGSRKPKNLDEAIQRVGDNIYYKENEKWRDIKSLHDGMLDQDTGKGKRFSPKVFFSSKFWYRGAFAEPLEKKYLELLKKGKGTKKRHENVALVEDFKKWVGDNFDMGVAAFPNDGSFKALREGNKLNDGDAKKLRPATT